MERAVENGLANGASGRAEQGASRSFLSSPYCRLGKKVRGC
jgi:hypothetical protein